MAREQKPWRSRVRRGRESEGECEETECDGMGDVGRGRRRTGGLRRETTAKKAGTRRRQRRGQPASQPASQPATQRPTYSQASLLGASGTCPLPVARGRCLKALALTGIIDPPLTHPSAGVRGQRSRLLVRQRGPPARGLMPRRGRACTDAGPPHRSSTTTTTTCIHLRIPPVPQRR